MVRICRKGTYLGPYVSKIDLTELSSMNTFYADHVRRNREFLTPNPKHFGAYFEICVWGREIPLYSRFTTTTHVTELVIVRCLVVTQFYLFILGWKLCEVAIIFLC